MPAHTQEQFEQFMSQLKETNTTLDFYCDFAKIGRNVNDIAISLNTLNYLLGKTDLRTAVDALWRRDPQCFEVMDILIATREREGKLFLNADGEYHLIHSLFNGVDGIMEFLEGTGLSEVFQQSLISNLVDYVFGVETGLDTNARKNRSGKIMEHYVASVFRQANVAFQEQVPSRNFQDVEQVLGADQKVFDFAINTNAQTFLVEANFYSTGGSKLNEVARSYTDIAPKINRLQGFEFVWITDGVGWRSAKNKLEEAFMAIPSVYNITTLQTFIDRLS